MPHNTPSIKKIWNISWPIIISLTAQNIVNVTDTAFLGHMGAVELGTSAIGNLFYVILFMVAYGFTTSAQMLIPRIETAVSIVKSFVLAGATMTMSEYNNK